MGAVTGVERIAIERVRQVEAEGYDAAHDAEHDGGQLAMAAACYAACAAGEQIYVMDEYASQLRFSDPWPWSDGSDARPYDGNAPKEPTDEQVLRLLEKAGALIAAEIDRVLAVRAASDKRKGRKHA
jgi:hypothetical protein